MIGLHSTRLALLLVLLIAPVLQTSNAAERGAEEKLLGAPCRGRYQLSPQTSAARRAINRKHDAAMKQRDYETVVAMRKELIRYQCHNHFLWFYLAELYVELGQNDDAIAVLDYLYGKKENEVDRRLRTEGNALHPLAQAHEFQRSALARKLSQARALREERKQQYRKKLEALPQGKKPPRDYVSQDACPFECCTFRTWDVYADTILYDKPRGEKVVARVGKGEKVEGVTGQVHIRPMAVAVRHSPPYSNVPAGSIVFLLDSLGEGIGRVWVDGKVLELDVAGNIHDHCPFPDKRCWGEYIYPVTEDERWGTWWVKVKTRDGVVGWTKESKNFGNMDACA